MWVVKLGGSLNDAALLPQWLDLLVQLGGGRVTLVCGGGRFADEVRRARAHWQLEGVSGHNMAVLAMAQAAWLVQGLDPRLRVARSDADIRRVLHGGHTALWLPLDHVRGEAAADDRDGDVSSDDIALDLARQLSVERMVLVKSRAVEPGASLADLNAAGVLDSRFARLAADAVFPIDVVHGGALGRMRSLLLGEDPAAVN